MPNFALHLPINGTSFGNLSVLLLHEVFKLGAEPNLFLIGNPDFSVHDTLSKTDGFVNWINNCINKSIKSHNRNVPILKLWHLNGSLSSFSKDQNLITFYELDSPTREEINTINNQNKTFVTSKFTKQVFEDFGAERVNLINLPYDTYNYHKKDKIYFEDGRITFNMVGKLEPSRKRHAKVIQNWIKKYGNNPKYFLQCCIYNNFLKPEDNQALINQILGGNKYFNVHFMGWMNKNSLYNDYLNSGDIVIGMGNEAWGIPEFHSAGLKKQVIVSNFNGHKSWATPENSILVNPSGKFDCYDGMFFNQGGAYNQGKFFDFDDDEFLAACEKAVGRIEAGEVNEEGLKLRDEFEPRKVVGEILNQLI